MFTRRSFFRRAAAIIAAVALAPEIAFNVRLKLAGVVTPTATATEVPFWIETRKWAYCTSESYRQVVAESYTGKPSECWTVV